MSENTHIKIDGKDHSVEAGATILQACKDVGINIPTLCFLEGYSHQGSCSICVVEVKNAKTLLRSCVTHVTAGMEISTNTQRVRNARRINLELLLAGHKEDCFVCDKNQSCELRKLSYDLGIKKVDFPKAVAMQWFMDSTSPSIVRNPDKCILCRRCIAACSQVQSVHAINTAHRGKMSHVTTFMDKGLGNVQCINCGQCVLVCPTGAIVEKDEIQDVWSALSDPNKVVVVQTAPAVRVAIGEEFEMPAGSISTGKMAAALRRVGFNKVFDTQFTADLTIMEEGHELIKRIKEGGKLPLITSCSPGWIKFAEHFYPGVIPHISSCKSPQQMFGAVAKTYYAQKIGIDPRNLVVVSIMPCTAKKFEAKRPEMDGAFKYWQKKMDLKEEERFPDVDHVLTTREAARMIKEAGVNVLSLNDEDFDDPLGASSGAAVIFGSSGGVMEAALRTAYEVLTGQTLDKVDFENLRGLEGIKTAQIDINGMPVKVAIANTLSKARILLDEIEQGKSEYAFIEIMTCPGGCLGGGGQPEPTNTEIRLKRMHAIYEEDRNKPLRKSHENPSVAKLYTDFLKEPLGHLSEELLHTNYRIR